MGRLHQEPAHARVPRFGDAPASLGFPGAQFAGDESQIRLDLMSRAEARDIVDRRDERRGQEGRDLREPASGQREFANPVAEGFGGAGADAPAVLAEQRADHRDVAGPGPHERVAHGEAGPHVALLIGQAMRSPVGAEHTRLGQGARVPSVRLHFAGALRVHRREVRVGDDHLVTQRLEAPAPPTRFRSRTR